ncbi:immunoglobulin superfamily member 3-like, partial [Mantella aurantiaca]
MTYRYMDDDNGCVSRAQRVVTVQRGPLYRTVGSHVSIWCHVGGFQGPPEQNFQYSIYLPSAPDREVQILSTGDPNFSYAIYSARVSGGDIYVERASGDRTLLNIRQLQERDAGEYECHTPNTDPTYHGSYSAKMNLSVIPDTLVVSSTPQTIQKVEGGSLQLSCDVSRASAQHTHLSVSWYRKSGEQLEEVLSLTRDFSLQAGSSYAQRFSLGDVRLDKVGDSAFRLSLFNLQTTDQGEFYCQGTEWIQDPDATWFAMTSKRSQGSEVTVQPTNRELNVRLDTDRRTYSAGETAELRCIIEAQNAADRMFAVSWVFNSSLMGSVSPGGVPTLTGEYSQRESRGELRVSKESDNTFLLKVFRLRPEDSGKYNCRVMERERSASGEMTDRDIKRPKNIPITVLPL